MKLRVYIKPGFTDMRKSWNGLYGLILNEMELDSSWGVSIFVQRSFPEDYQSILLGWEWVLYLAEEVVEGELCLACYWGYR